MSRCRSDQRSGASSAEVTRRSGRFARRSAETSRAPMRTLPRASPAMTRSSVDAPHAGGPTIAVWVDFAKVTVAPSTTTETSSIVECGGHAAARSLERRHGRRTPNLLPIAALLLQRAVSLEAVEEGAHARPLRVAQHAAHVDEHHQLALEEAAARGVQPRGAGLHGAAVELRPVELRAQGDVLFLDLGAGIDQVARRGAPDVLELLLLIAAEAELLHDLRPAPPLAGREVGGERRRRQDDRQQREGEAFHSELPFGACVFASSHVSHWTMPWKSRSSSDCQASCATGSSAFGGAA